jgi:DNA-binding PadR family transcriptional regulator
MIPGINPGNVDYAVKRFLEFGFVEECGKDGGPQARRPYKIYWRLTKLGKQLIASELLSSRLDEYDPVHSGGEEFAPKLPPLSWMLLQLLCALRNAQTPVDPHQLASGQSFTGTSAAYNLDRLVDRGYASFVSNVGGRSRKHYALTTEGEAFIEQLATKFRELGF